MSADKITLNPGAAGSSVATDKLDDKHHQYIKVEYGADGSATPVSTDNPLPVTLGSLVSHVIIDSGAITMPTGTATEATLAAMSAKLPASLGQKAAAASMSVVLASDQGDVPVSGTFYQETQPVSGTFWQETQPVSLASVPSHAVTQSGTWNIGTVTTITGITNAVVVNGGESQTSDIKVTLDSESVAVTGTFYPETQPVSGTFWQETQPVSLASLPALAAGTNLIGKTSAGLDTANVYNGTTALTPKFQNVSAATSGNNALIAAAGEGVKIRVLAMQLQGSGTAVSGYLSSKDDTGTKLYGDGTNKFVLDKTGATGPAGFSLPFSPLGWFETAANEALNLNLSAAQAVVGTITYVEVTV